MTDGGYLSCSRPLAGEIVDRNALSTALDDWIAEARTPLFPTTALDALVRQQFGVGLVYCERVIRGEIIPTDDVLERLSSALYSNPHSAAGARPAAVSPAPRAAGEAGRRGRETASPIPLPASFSPAELGAFLIGACSALGAILAAATKEQGR